MTEFTRMKVHRLVLDPNTNSPIVILQDEETGAMLPIWIGIFEAHAIAMKLEGVDSPRPMTHDLLSNAIREISGAVTRVDVVDLQDNTYYARIHVLVGDKNHELDSRPSDAIALALRAEAPVYVANHVLERSQIEPAEAGEGEEGESEEDEWTRILKNFNPPGDPEKVN